MTVLKDFLFYSDKQNKKKLSQSLQVQSLNTKMSLSPPFPPQVVEVFSLRCESNRFSVSLALFFSQLPLMWFSHPASKTVQPQLSNHSPLSHRSLPTSFFLFLW
ncbi:hypothetical protein CHARACLAT_018971 [Characodon lateralis]|uniref:Uncharacterized protein n=1 Tax=Characodon lateralis TaxID=208331 RepID=A0ABU7CPC1_9TELE|nr:hypothetical protein [Characodon lateralis]